MDCPAIRVNSEIAQVDGRQLVAEEIEAMLKRGECERRFTGSRRRGEHDGPLALHKHGSVKEEQIRPQALQFNRDVFVEMKEKIGRVAENVAATVAGRHGHGFA